MFDIFRGVNPLAFENRLCTPPACLVTAQLHGSICCTLIIYLFSTVNFILMDYITFSRLTLQKHAMVFRKVMYYGNSIDNYSVSESSLQSLERVYEKDKIKQLRGKNF